MKIIVALCMFLPVAFAAPNATPRKLLGLWAVKGQCAKTSQQLLIRNTTLQFAHRAPEEIRFFANDAANGAGAFHWKEEGIVSNIQYLESDDLLVSNPSGYGYPSDVVYRRCAVK